MASNALAASGPTTSGDASLAGRWLLTKSAVGALRPFAVQGIRVGATSAGALTATALAAAVASNAAAFAAVHYGFRAGVWMGSLIVGTKLCEEW